MTIDTTMLLSIAGVVTAITVICSAIAKIFERAKAWNKQVDKWNNYDKEICDIKANIQQLREEQCMQTYVLEAVLDGLHQLGCNGKTTQASQTLAKFINKQAHGMNDGQKKEKEKDEN